ncbi:hypothetical protein AUTU_46080 (plasmid) [Aureibacter tunicatorum]|nr:hypothetical protein AUTU_46080 [Aureibacter tunicatorum]
MYENNLKEIERLDKTQLSQMLQYKNENVISRFTDMFDVKEAEAEDIFEETKKFLFLAQVRGIMIPDELLIIDEMWHNFILFTKDYHEFSQNIFKKYMHHLPASKSEKEAYANAVGEEKERLKAEFENKLRLLMNLTYENFGEETLMKWFKEYPEKYSSSNIKALRKK